MRLPDFIIIGAQKAGTTWLAKRLSEHPGIFMPRPFETHFFKVDRIYANGLNSYAAYFADAKPAQVAGEKTPDYLRTFSPSAQDAPDIAGRIHSAVPDVKLICVLRDPVKRSISAFNHHVRARRLSPWKSFERWAKEFLDQGTEPHKIFSGSYYNDQLEAYREKFPDEQILILIFEDDVQARPAETVARVCDFLGIANHYCPTRSPENRGLHSWTARIINYYLPRLYLVASALDRILPSGGSSDLSEETKRRLYAHYEPYNQHLFTLIGKDITSWSSAGGGKHKSDEPV